MNSRSEDSVRCMPNRAVRSGRILFGGRSGKALRQFLRLLQYRYFARGLTRNEWWDMAKTTTLAAGIHFEVLHRMRRECRNAASNGRTPKAADHSGRRPGAHFFRKRLTVTIAQLERLDKSFTPMKAHMDRVTALQPQR